MVTIIDISYAQDSTKIDYGLLADSVDGVVARLHYGVRHDIQFDNHYRELFILRNVPFGVYGFPTSYDPMDKQISALTTMIAGRTIPLGRWVDVEQYPDGGNLLNRQNVHDYMQQAEGLHGRFGIYTSKKAWQDIMGGVYYADRKLWVANYTTAAQPALPQGWTSWWLWQYTSSGRLPGYANYLDMNRFWGTDAQYLEWIGSEPAPYGEPLQALWFPVDPKWPVSQPFGVNPQWYPTSQGHNGEDRATPVGTPVYAMADGICQVARDDGDIGYGLHLRFSHPDNDNDITILGHLSQLFVGVGEFVRGKQLIGLSGNTGNSTGPHIHYELRRGTPITDPGPGEFVYNAVDPAPLLVEWDMSETPSDWLFQAICICTELNVRTGPSINYPRTRSLYKGDQVGVYEVVNNWFRISGSEWCSGYPQYMQVIESPSSDYDQGWNDVLGTVEETIKGLRE